MDPVGILLKSPPCPPAPPGSPAFPTVSAASKPQPPLPSRAVRRREIPLGVRRRQALHLPRRCGGYQVGRAFLVPRESVLLFLAAQRADEELPEIEAQKRHVADFLGQAREQQQPG